MSDREELLRQRLTDDAPVVILRRPGAAPAATATVEQMAAFTLASQQALFSALAFNPHQRRGPDGRWIKMPTSELKRPRARKAPRPKVELPRADSMEAPTPAPRAASTHRAAVDGWNEQILKRAQEELNGQASPDVDLRNTIWAAQAELGDQRNPPGAADEIFEHLAQQLRDGGVSVPDRPQRAPLALPEAESFNTPNPMSDADPIDQWRQARHDYNVAILNRALHWLNEAEQDHNEDPELERLVGQLREDLDEPDFEGAGFRADDISRWLASEYDDEELPVAPMRPQTPGLGDSFRPGGLAPEDEAYRQLRNEYNGGVYALGDYVRQNRQGPEHARLGDAVWRLEQELADDPAYADEAADDLKQLIENEYPEFALMLPPAPRQMMTIGGNGPGRPDRPPVTAPYAERAAALADSRGSGITAETSLSGGIMGDTRMLTLGDGTRAVYKKALRAWNTPGVNWSTKDQTDAEELSSVLAAELGVRAPAIDRLSDNELLMEVMPGKPANALGLTADQRDDLIASDAGMKLGLLDVLLDNSDRHTGNFMVDGDQVYAIDHGLAFLHNPPPGRSNSGPSMFARGYFVDGQGNYLRENQLTQSDIEYAEEAIERARPRFADLDREDWATQALARLYMLGSRARGRDPLYK